MIEHSALAPSAAHRWVHCPGSVKLCAQAPAREESEAAREGTAAHAVMAEWLRTGACPDNADPDVEAALSPLADYVLGRPNADVEVETWMGVPAIHEACSGTPDVVIYDTVDGACEIVDLKYGWRPTDAREQLLCYAVGAWDMLDEQRHRWTYKLTVYQPRPWHAKGPLRTVELSAAELASEADRLREAAHAAMGNDPRTVAGPWCRDCPAAATCASAREAALGRLERALPAVPEALPPEALGRELALLEQGAAALDARLAALREHALAHLKDGRLVPGWTVERTPGREAWTQDASVAIAAAKLYGIDISKPPSALTPGQARKAGVPAEIVAALSARGPGTLKLAPETNHFCK